MYIVLIYTCICITDVLKQVYYIASWTRMIKVKPMQSTQLGIRIGYMQI